MSITPLKSLLPTIEISLLAHKKGYDSVVYRLDRENRKHCLWAEKKNGMKSKKYQKIGWFLRFLQNQ